ncbi:SdpI family protein [Cohnella thermotolerans]|uniref:SdpI family protein n=1 Tax=Cohnella thermotolerans TaxID=329858 RepID=UPI0003FB1789|nr:SdpI family protein [Cohnella thermotolerans]
MTNRQQQETPNGAKPVLWSRRDWILPLVNAALVAAAYLLFNDKLPARIASHYDFHGNPNRTMAKETFWLLYAALTILIPVALTISRALDPRKANYVKFQSYFNLIRWTISLFLQVIFYSMVVDQTDGSFSFVNVVLGALGVMWMLLGNRMGQVKSNFFIGIRTPWALSSESNWTRTHRLAAKLWFAAGLAMFLLAWFVPASWAVAILLIGALGSSLTPTFYSYILYKRSLG